ncbi:MAG: hypothetical protein WA213_20865 [Terriglobales bacterium]
MSNEPKQETLIDIKVKPNRHVAVALNHLNKRRDALLAQRAKLTEEIEGIDEAILALE